MYKAIVDNKVFEIDSGESGWLVNGERQVWDLVQLADGYFHILYKNKSYRAEIIKTDPETKSFTFKINGNSYSVNQIYLSGLLYSCCHLFKTAIQ